MLGGEKIDDKTQDEIWEEVFDSLSACASEWTDFNDSDPGITVLQMLSWLTKKQRTEIQEQSFSMDVSLLKFLGFVPEKAKPAMAFAHVQRLDECGVLLAETRFSAPDSGVLFENWEDRSISSARIIGLFADTEGKASDLSVISERRGGNFGFPFGKEPKAGNAFCIVLDRPLELETEVCFFFQQHNGQPVRNPLRGSMFPQIGEIQWEIFTEKGWSAVEVTDHTHGLLVSGTVAFQIRREMIQHEQYGFCLRAVVKEANYDVPPRLQGMFINAVPVRQAVTIAGQRVLPYRKEQGNKIRIRVPRADKTAVMLFVKDQQGRFRWYKNKDRAPEEQNGWFRMSLVNDEELELTLCGCCGYLPEAGSEAVRVVLLDTDYVNKLRHGILYGYDDQTIELGVRGIVEKTFRLLISEQKGDSVYFEEPEAENFLFELDGKNGILTVRESSYLEENLVIPCRCQLSSGAAGRVKDDELTTCHSPHFRSMGNTAAFFGKDEETEMQVKQRMAQSLYHPAGAVTESDYAELVRGTPGLALDRIRVYRETGNEVVIIVKPASYEMKPVLSSEYRRVIRAHLEQYRLLTVDIRIESVTYTAVNVYAEVEVNPYCQNGEEIIRSHVRQELIYEKREKNIGDPLDPEELHSQLDSLPCVLSVRKLSFEAEKDYLSRDKNGMLVPERTALICPGVVTIVVV